MRNMLTVMRRDLAAYFTSPIGYIFIMIFVFSTVGVIYMLLFFVENPEADMRWFFNWLPPALCVFIPAATMRVWAEERKENTWEMLLTFPMRGTELVLGKFLALLAFYLITLLCTWTLPATLYWLGNPDGGTIFGGYLGALFIGGFFLALGIFFSGFCKDQIVAFVVTLVACFTVYMLGTPYIARFIDERLMPGLDLGTALMRIVGVIDHYDTFIRGVIELNDVLYFIVWTALFLLLNILYINGRHRPYAKAKFAGAIVASLVIGLGLNSVIVDTSLYRMDVTEDSIYTVSETSENILRELEDPVNVNVYITPSDRMPTALKQLEERITDKLQELRLASGGNLDWNVVYLDPANAVVQQQQPEQERELMEGFEEIGEEEEPEAEVEEETRTKEEVLGEKGVDTWVWRSTSRDQVTNRLIYSSLGITLGEREEVIINAIEPTDVLGIEYLVISTLYKARLGRDPIVALFAPKEFDRRINSKTMQLLLKNRQRIPTVDQFSELHDVLVEERYDVRRIELTKESPLPEKFDTLIVVAPNNYSVTETPFSFLRTLTRRQQWEIGRALRSGKSVFIAAQEHELVWRRDLRQWMYVDHEPGVDRILRVSGVQVDDSVLMDRNFQPLPFPNPQTGEVIPLVTPAQILVTNSSMDHSTSISSRLANVFYPYGSSISIDEDALMLYELLATPLMYTSPGAWSLQAPENNGIIPVEAMRPPEGGNQFPLMAMLSGQFPDAFPEEERPDWRIGGPDEEEPPAQPVEAQPGKLIVAGCSWMLRDGMFTRGDNKTMLLNCVDALTLGDELVNVRANRVIDRAIDMPNREDMIFFVAFNMGFSTILVAGVGVLVALFRKAGRDTYTNMYAKK